MRKLIALAVVVLILAAGCTPLSPTPPATAVAPATGVAPATAVAPAPAPATAIARAPGTAAAPAAASPAPGEVAATPATQPARPSPTPDPNDKTKPSLSIAVDPPAIDWEGQAVVTVRASDPAGIKEIDVMLGDQLLATGDGEELELDFIPGAIDGLQGGTSYKLVAQATDPSGNTAEASASIKVGPEPTDTPAPKAAAATTPTARATQSARGAAAPTEPPGQAARATPAGGTDVITATVKGATTYRVTEIKLPAYPYAGYLKQTTDPGREDYPVYTLDQSAYSAGNPQPQLKSYRLLVLENRYLRLGILPDLGGRIYECIFKPTGSNEFYSNTVVKPTNWGPPSPPYPPGANWWLGTGGLEWGFPVEEHGYEFGTVWGFDHAAQDDGGVMITVFTKTGPQNPYAVVDIILPPDTAYFVVQPRVVNPTGGPFQFKFWENAMLAPGKANSVSPDLRFLFPANQVTVHSTGDQTLPQAGQTMSWPVVNGRDLSRLGNWTNYLGFFASPVVTGPGASAFAAVYDLNADEGMVRVFPPSVAKGVKLFAPRGSDGLDPKLWTDDGSSYVELHGGFTPNYSDWKTLGPGEEATWSETWYPVAWTGGVTFANDRAAMMLGPAQIGVRLALFPTTAMAGRVTVTLPGLPPQSFDAQFSPDQPFVRGLALDPALAAALPKQGEVHVTVVSTDGETVFDWQGVAQLQ